MAIQLALEDNTKDQVFASRGGISSGACRFRIGTIWSFVQEIIRRHSRVKSNLTSGAVIVGVVPKPRLRIIRGFEVEIWCKHSGIGWFQATVETSVGVGVGVVVVV